jgi:hypothetical protein
MSVFGTVKNGVVVLDEGTSLPGRDSGGSGGPG